MLKILCCCKWVADEAYLRADSSGHIDLSLAEYRLNEYDRHALEEAVHLKNAHEADISVLTVALPEHGKAMKDALSRGADRAFFVNSPAYEDLEPSQTAAILAAVIEGQGPFDLILCGESSSDQYASQTGPRLAYRLGIPSIVSVSQMKVEGDQVIAIRKSQTGSELIGVPLPCLVTVTPDINTPRIPGLKDTLSASKKPLANIDNLDIRVGEPARVERLSMQAAQLERKVKMLAFDSEGLMELARILVNHSRKGA